MFLIGIGSVCALGGLYLFIRGWQSLEFFGRRRVWFAVVFWTVNLSFLVAHLLKRKGVLIEMFDVFFSFGFYYYMAMLLYGFLILLALDFLRMVGWAGKIKPDFIYRNYPLSKAILFGAVCLALTIILIAGYYNAHRPRATYIEISVDKQAGQRNNLRIVMVSDVHMGKIHGRKSLARIVDKINEQRPDLVLLVGDIFDGSPEPVFENNMGEEYERLKSKYGTYLIAGNHEYIGRSDLRMTKNPIVDYMAAHGVQTLLDSVILIDNSFYVAGRRDRSNRNRKSIPELLRHVNHQLPIILADHQPFHLNDAAEAEVDLYLSGHTHHGQLWPLNYITQKIYELDWGFLQKGKTYYYISCGVGTWGPPIRTAGYSEVVVIDMIFSAPFFSIPK